MALMDAMPADRNRTDHQNDAIAGLLVPIARHSIQHGLRSNSPRSIKASDLPLEIRAPGASFVTLKIGERLRGCIGTLEAHQPLGLDVNHNAYKAAFSDPRFPPLNINECGNLNIHISILTAPVPFPAQSEQDLLRQIRPKQDGLYLTYANNRATFLPSVWSIFPDPNRFVNELKIKAGLPADFWSDEIQFQRYTVIDVDAGTL